MSQAAQNLRDILALARMLRGLAGQHTHDQTYDQFLETATELEQRARRLSTAASTDLKRDEALHSSIDLRI